MSSLRVLDAVVVEVGPLAGAEHLGGGEELLTHLTRKGYPIIEVETRQPRMASEAGQLADKIMQQLGTSATSPTGQRYVPQRAAAVDPKRPNYLAKIKAFALGE